MTLFSLNCKNKFQHVRKGNGELDREKQKNKEGD